MAPIMTGVGNPTPRSEMPAVGTKHMPLQHDRPPTRRLQRLPFPWLRRLPIAPLPRRGSRAWMASLPLLIWLLASAGWLAGANADEFLPRSPAQPRSMRADELRLPRFRERQSHRGWEIREARFTVLATTSAEDARWAAEQMAEAWEDLEQLADRFTEIHRQENFAIGSTLVRVDELERHVEEAAPNAAEVPAAEVVDLGGQVLIRLRISEEQDQDDDGELLARAQLRHAATHAFLAVSQMDQKLPRWACEGLARSIAGKDISTKHRDQVLDSLTPPERDRQRISPDRVETPDREPSRSPETIQFLLEGDDARHLADLFQALEETLLTAVPAPRQWTRRNPGDELAPEPEAPPLETLADQTQLAFQRWQTDPLSGQPRIESAQDLPPGLEERQQRMAFLLKLMWRFGDARPAALAGTVDGSQPTRRVKVQEFGRPAGSSPSSAIAAPTSDRSPPDRASTERLSTERPSPDTARPRSVHLGQLYRRLMASRLLWATQAPDGQLLCSDDPDSLRTWLQDLWDPRYSAEQQGFLWRLAYRLPDGRVLSATLDAGDSESERIPIRFDVRSATSRAADPAGVSGP